MTGVDRLSQNGQEIHALCDLSLSLVGNPCPLRSVIPACRESMPSAICHSRLSGILLYWMWQDEKKEGFWTSQNDKERRRRILPILDRRGQAKPEWTRNPCPLRSVTFACRESMPSVICHSRLSGILLYWMWQDKKKDSGQARMTRRRRILSILDRQGQAKPEWTRSPCPL